MEGTHRRSYHWGEIGSFTIGKKHSFPEKVPPRDCRLQVKNVRAQKLLRDYSHELSRHRNDQEARTNQQKENVAY